MLSFGPRSRCRCLFQRAPRLLLLALAAAFARGQATEYAGTLPEDYLPGLKALLGTALQQSPQVLLRDIEIARNEARVYQADQQRWPNVGGDIRYASSETVVSSHTGTRSRDSGLFYSASVNQAVFHWGEIRNRGEIARIEVAIARKDYVEAYRTLAVELRRGYLGLIALNARLRHTRFSLSLVEADLAGAREELAHGAIPAGDVAVRELALAEAQLDADRLEADFEAERRKVARLAGVPDIAPETIPPEIPEPAFDPAVASRLLAELLRDGARSTFQAQVAEMQIKEADLSYRIARVRLLPRFDALMGHSRESSTTASTTQVSQTAITRNSFEVRGEWRIFDGFATKGAKLEAKQSRRYWERRFQIATEAAMDEAQRLQRTVGFDFRAMQFARQRHAGATAGVARAEEEVRAHAAAPNAVTYATRDLRSAEAGTALARATFLSNWSAFVSLVADDPALNQIPSRYVRATR